MDLISGNGNEIVEIFSKQKKNPLLCSSKYWKYVFSSLIRFECISRYWFLLIGYISLFMDNMKSMSATRNINKLNIENVI